MQNLPLNINFLIGDYIFDCKKNALIINKEFQNIYMIKTKKCKKIKVAGRFFCENCEKKRILGARMVMNNLITGYIY